MTCLLHRFFESLLYFSLHRLVLVVPGDYDWTLKVDADVAVVPERLRAAGNP